MPRSEVMKMPGVERMGLAVVVRISPEEIEEASYQIGGVPLLLMERFISEASRAMEAYQDCRQKEYGRLMREQEEKANAGS
jgi:hypothetical protein